jgi:hypothetical protein
MKNSANSTRLFKSNRLSQDIVRRPQNLKKIFLFDLTLLSSNVKSKKIFSNCVVFSHYNIALHIILNFIRDLKVSANSLSVLFPLQLNYKPSENLDLP